MKDRIHPRSAPLVFISNALDPPDDEGTRRFARTLARYAQSAGIRVIAVSQRDPIQVKKLLLSPRLMVDIRRSEARTVVYLPAASASAGSFLRSAVLRAGARVRVVLIAMRPVPCGLLGELVARAFGPQLVLTPSPRLLSDLRSLRLRAAFIPMGVDVDRFLPGDDLSKRRLRKKYGLPEDRRVVLHVGHLQPLRNLAWMVNIRDAVDAMAVVVGGTAMGVDPHVSAQLATAGVHVINDYLPNMEEIYNLADAYVFPVKDEGAAVGVPLSVLEGMACNLPVVTTSFGALRQMFLEGDGLCYADTCDGFVTAVQNALNLPAEAVRTRKKVLPYSWANVIPLIFDKAQQVAAG